jgi:hypothetical protein
MVKPQRHKLYRCYLYSQLEATIISKQRRVTHMSTFKLIDEEIYPKIVQRAEHDERWAAYLLLINICFALVENIPTTQLALEEVDIEKLLIQMLENIGTAIHKILPGGMEEFYYYLPDSQKNTASQ